MADTKARKLTYDELFNSTTMFYINQDCEESIKRTIDEQTADILVGLIAILIQIFIHQIQGREHCANFARFAIHHSSNVIVGKSRIF